MFVDENPVVLLPESSNELSVFAFIAKARLVTHLINWRDPITGWRNGVISEPLIVFLRGPMSRESNFLCIFYLV